MELRSIAQVQSLTAPPFWPSLVCSLWFAKLLLQVLERLKQTQSGLSNRVTDIV